MENNIISLALNNHSYIQLLKIKNIISDNIRIKKKTILNYYLSNVKYCNITILETLLSYGLSINMTDDSKLTPLHSYISSCDVRYCYENIVRCLIRYGADVLSVNEYGKTPLYVYLTTNATKHNYSIIHLLLSARSNTHLPDGYSVGNVTVTRTYEDGMTVIHDYIRYNYEIDSSILKLLLSYIKTEDRHMFRNLLYMYMGSKYSILPEVVEMLSVFDDGYRDELGDTSLMQYLNRCKKTDLSIVKLAIELGQDINTLNLEGYSPLHYYMFNCPTIKGIKTFVSLGAYVIQGRAFVTDYLSNPLVDIIVLKYIINITGGYKNNYSCLYYPFHTYLSNSSNFLITSFLLNYYNDVINEINLDGNSPLFESINWSMPERTVKYLIDNGADINILCSNDSTIFSKAMVIAKPHILNILISYKPSVTTLRNTIRYFIHRNLLMDRSVINFLVYALSVDTGIYDMVISNRRSYMYIFVEIITRCYHEVIKMKNTKLYGSLSLYKVVFEIDKNHIHRYTNLICYEQVNQYSIYSKTLKKYIRTSRKRYNLIMRVLKIFDKLPLWGMLPVELLLKIIEMINTQDLISFVELDN
ncbi:putative ankyrin repeat protein FPV162 [BeAn 58058 virus]|uniref:putative ankyrin repeat protein FPV162 n=1 Tax=BeAn 58058 virus TaxID=67082 RepID=UPI00090BA9CC|nr:putative ankyrin repeat protein FPV162 [BeAn 58058 virus]APG58205.1 putative ankyrin repeat protein FPV162 [BeAn 58058 virus]